MIYERIKSHDVEYQSIRLLNSDLLMETLLKIT